MRRSAPMILSLGNVVLGVCAAFLFLGGYRVSALICIIGAAVLDVLDGWAARRLGTADDSGKTVDTAADLTSFGITPSLCIVVTTGGWPGWTAAGIYFAAILFRLVRFWRSSPGTGVFRGMPSPSTAMAVVGACVAAAAHPSLAWLAPVAALVFAALAVSMIPYPKLTHPALGGMPVWAKVLIYGGHGVFFVFMPGLAVLSLMTVYIVLGPLRVKWLNAKNLNWTSTL